MAKESDNTLTFRYDEGILTAFVFAGLALFAAYLFASETIQDVMASVLGLGDDIVVAQFRFDHPFWYHFITFGSVLGFVGAWLTGFVVGGHPGVRTWVISGQHLLKGKEAINALQEVEYNLMSQAQIERKLITPPQTQIANKEGDKK